MPTTKLEISKEELAGIQNALDCIDEHIKNAEEEYDRHNKNARLVQASHLNPNFKQTKKK